MSVISGKLLTFSPAVQGAAASPQTNPYQLQVSEYLSLDNARPYTVIEKTLRLRGSVDEYFLVYQETKLPLTPTEYALVTSLLNRCGFNQSEAESKRRELVQPSRTEKYEKPISVPTQLSFLRAKIAAVTNQIIIPVWEGAPSLSGLRMWTNQEIKDLRRSMKNTGEGVTVIKDECNRNHLFINGCKLKFHKNVAVDNVDILMAEKIYSPEGFCADSPDFIDAYCKITGRTEISVASLRNRISAFKKALGAAGLLIKKSRHGTSRDFLKATFSLERVQQAKKPSFRIVKLTSRWEVTHIDKNKTYRIVPKVWNSSSVRLLKLLWTMGLTTNSIAEKLGTGKNAVVGKSHRLNLPPRPSPIKRSDNEACVSEATRRQTALPVGHVIRPAFPWQPLAIEEGRQESYHQSREIDVARDFGDPIGSEFMRNVETCCWPFGDPCSDSALPKKPYCEGHANLAYIETPKQEEPQEVLRNQMPCEPSLPRYIL